MSNVALENGLESPQQETARRFADQSPAWGLPRIFAAQNLQAMWADARKRLHDSHRAEMQTLGVEVQPNPEEMGNTTIQGDTYNYSVPQPAKSTAGKLGTALISAASVAIGLGTGAGGLTVLQWWLNRPQTPVVQPVESAKPADWKLGIEVRDEP